MIDNLVLEERARPSVNVTVMSMGAYGRVHRKLVLDPRLDRMFEWLRVAGPGFWLGWCEETRACQLLLSIPRIHNIAAGGTNSNFPLHDFAMIDEMRLAETSLAVLGLLGITGAKDGQDAVRILGLPKWIVRRVAYAADVYMEEADAFIGEVAALPRKRRTQVHVWGRPGLAAHTAQWEASGVRVQFYRKDLQLEQRIKYLRTDDDALGRRPRGSLTRVAERASNMVRMEVTLGNLRAIRKALKFDAPAAPTFRLMALREVNDYIFGRELSRLRLLGVRGEGRDVEGASGDRPMPTRPKDEAARIRGLYERFIEKQESYNRSDMGRRAPISPTRLRSLFATYMLLGPYNHQELLSRGGYATSTLSKDLRQLDDLGLPPTGTAAPDIQVWLEVYMARLRALMPAIRTELPEERDNWDGLARDVPWADDDEDPINREREFDMDVTSSEFQELLDEVAHGLEGPDAATGGRRGGS